MLTERKTPMQSTSLNEHLVEFEVNDKKWDYPQGEGKPKGKMHVEDHILKLKTKQKDLDGDPIFLFVEVSSHFDEETDAPEKYVFCSVKQYNSTDWFCCSNKFSNTFVKSVADGKEEVLRFINKYFP